MDQENSSFVPRNASGEGQLFLTDIVIKRTDPACDGRPPLSLTELWVFGIPDSEEGKSYTLMNGASGQWHMKDFITVPAGVAGVHCVVKGEEGEDLAFVHLDRTTMQSAHMHSEYRHSQTMQMCEEGVCLIISWKKVGMPLDTILPTEDIGALNDSGVGLMRQFERTGDLVAITKAIEVLHTAVQLTPEGHVDLPSRLNNLGNAFHRRFLRTGDVSDIVEAISAHHRAVQLTPQGHVDMPARLNNLGNSFQRRFERTRDLFDIAEAISAQRRAVQLTPESHEDLPTCLNNLGNSYLFHFECTRNPPDITEAISVQHRAVQLIPKGHENLPRSLSNLGNSFQRRFECTGDPSDIAEAIAALCRAVELTPEGHANLPRLLNNLGNSYLRRFRCNVDLSDIAKAISAHGRAVQLTPNGHAALPGRLNNLGYSYLHRFQRACSEDDLVASISNYKSAATSSFGPPRHRLQAARMWAQLLNDHYPQSPYILHAFDTALALIALIAGLEESVWGRYSQLQDIGGMALEAASAACSLGRPDKALEWLEQGRCVVWSQLSNLRTPINDLRLHNSQLAQSVADVAKQLENAGSSRGQSHFGLSTSDKISLEDEAKAHLNLARQWEDLLTTVRSIPGFESFLQPLLCSSLLEHLPASGPVVVVNVDKQRCDAIALLDGLGEPLHIPLPDFSLEKANKYRGALKATLEDKHLRMREVQESTDGEISGRGVKRPKQNQSVVGQKVLQDLWKEVVSPILKALGFSVSV